MFFKDKAYDERIARIRKEREEKEFIKNWNNNVVPKYKLNDYVKVREDLIPYQTYNKCPYVPQMGCYKGKIFKITASSFTSYIKRYWLENVIYEFSEEMLEKVSKKELKQKHII